MATYIYLYDVNYKNKIRANNTKTEYSHESVHVWQDIQTKKAIVV